MPPAHLLNVESMEEGEPLFANFALIVAQAAATQKARAQVQRYERRVECHHRDAPQKLRPFSIFGTGTRCEDAGRGTVDTCHTNTPTHPPTHPPTIEMVSVRQRSLIVICLDLWNARLRGASSDRLPERGLSA